MYADLLSIIQKHMSNAIFYYYQLLCGRHAALMLWSTLQASQQPMTALISAHVCKS